MNAAAATLIAGVPAENPTLLRRLGVALGDPAAWVEIDGQVTLVVRDIERDRVSAANPGARVLCPADLAPPAGLDADRATATAQAVAQLLSDAAVPHVRTDRTLPFLFAWHIQQAGPVLEYDAQLGVVDRRTKSAEELEHLAAAQSVTEAAMEMACGRIAAARADRQGVLHDEGEPLTSERMRSILARFLLDRGFSMGHGAIIATAPQAGDCHHSGSGPLHTGVPVIVDIFPRDERTRYWGDCTRTVVHGAATDDVVRMHAAVAAAKRAAIDRLRVGVTAASVHQAATEVLGAHGFASSRGTISDQPTIQHGTGHGIGLELHEPILLDDGGGEILDGEVFTVEPGLYGRRTGGVRIEDMVAVTAAGPRNFNRLHEGLDWTS